VKPSTRTILTLSILLLAAFLRFYRIDAQSFWNDEGNSARIAERSVDLIIAGAAGALEAIVCVLTLKHGIIHPTINYEHPDPECDLDYVPNRAREVSVRVTLSNSFGLGGQNACLVLKKFER